MSKIKSCNVNIGQKKGFLRTFFNYLTCVYLNVLNVKRKLHAKCDGKSVTTRYINKDMVLERFVMLRPVMASDSVRVAGFCKQISTISGCVGEQCILPSV